MESQENLVVLDHLENKASHYTRHLSLPCAPITPPPFSLLSSVMLSPLSLSLPSSSAMLPTLLYLLTLLSRAILFLNIFIFSYLPIFLSSCLRPLPPVLFASVHHHPYYLSPSTTTLTMSTTRFPPYQEREESQAEVGPVDPSVREAQLEVRDDLAGLEMTAALVPQVCTSVLIPLVRQ